MCGTPTGRLFSGTQLIDQSHERFIHVFFDHIFSEEVTPVPLWFRSFEDHSQIFDLFQ
jgi:hypothetical protein